MVRNAGLAALLLIGFAFSVQAFSTDTPLTDLAQEQRARELFAQIRCPVCESQSIAESNAELAHDMRMLVRARVAAGEPDGQVLAYLQVRYGDALLLTPPLMGITYGLWIGPLLILILGAMAAMRQAHIRRSGASDGFRTRDL